MVALFDSPFTPILAATLVVALGLAIAARLFGLIAAAAPTVVFLVAYIFTYQKVPDFPPAGAANKIFYVGLIAGVVALGFERLGSRRLLRLALALAAALFAALWIGWSKLAAPDALAYPLAVVATILTALSLSRLDASALAPQGGAAALASLAAVSALAAPVALFGGSSTGVGLCLGLGLGAGVLSVEALISGRNLGPAAMLGPGAGLAAALDAMALITRRADPFALLLLAAAPFLAAYAIQKLPERWRANPIVVWLVSGLATLSPLPVIVALLFWRHDNPLAT